MLLVVADSVGGASVAELDVASRWCGLEAALGEVSCGMVWLCAITSPAGAIEIRAANINVLRVVMYLSRSWNVWHREPRSVSEVSAMN